MKTLQSLTSSLGSYCLYILLSPKSYDGPLDIFSLHPTPPSTSDFLISPCVPLKSCALLCPYHTLMCFCHLLPPLHICHIPEASYVFLWPLLSHGICIPSWTTDPSSLNPLPFSYLKTLLRGVFVTFLLLLFLWSCQSFLPQSDNPHG